MSITSYERLRMAHRNLQQHPITETDLRSLLVSLPASLDEIALARPALLTEVEAIRQFVSRLHENMARRKLTDKQEISARLHQALAPLFAG